MLDCRTPGEIMVQAQANSADTHDLNARLEVARHAAKDVAQIATLPEITLKIIEVVDNPNSTARDLQDLISNDPALCTRVLKVVNSAFYAMPQQVGSIERAIVLLGLNAVKNIAISSSMAKLFRGGRLTRDFSAKEVWSHSLAVAATVSLLAEEVKIDLPEQVFHAGLIHDLGLSVEMQAMRLKLVQVLDQAKQTGTPFGQCELDVFQADHQDFGLALCEAWKFPKAFRLAAGYHHRPMAVPEEDRPLPALVHVADVLASVHGIGFCAPTPGIKLNPAVIEMLKLTPNHLQSVAEKIPTAFADAEKLLD